MGRDVEKLKRKEVQTSSSTRANRREPVFGGFAETVGRCVRRRDVGKRRRRRFPNISDRLTVGSNSFENAEEKEEAALSWHKRPKTSNVLCSSSKLPV